LTSELEGGEGSASRPGRKVQVYRYKICHFSHCI